MKTLILNSNQKNTLMINLEEQLASFNHLLLSAEAITDKRIRHRNIEYFAKRVQDLDELLNIIKSSS